MALPPTLIAVTSRVLRRQRALRSRLSNPCKSSFGHHDQLIAKRGARGRMSRRLMTSATLRARRTPIAFDRAACHPTETGFRPSASSNR